MKVLLDLEEEIKMTNQVWEEEENKRKENRNQSPEKMQNLSNLRKKQFIFNSFIFSINIL